MTEPPTKPIRGIDVALFFTLIAAQVYAAGWAYAYRYFDHFHVGLLSITIPFEYFLIYGFWVIQHQWFWMTLLYGFFLGFWCGRHHPRLVALRHLLPTWWCEYGSVLPVVFILFVFVMQYYFGVLAANDSIKHLIRNDYMDFSPVEVWIENISAHDYGKWDSGHVRELASGCYRLLIQSHDNVYVFRPYGGGFNDTLPTEIVPVAQLRGLRVFEPGTPSCES